MQVDVFDTTLRDGTQGEGISLSVADKLHLAEMMDAFGIDLIEGGWPGSNPRDVEFFAQVRRLNLTHATLCSFGSTARKPGRSAEDPNLLALLASETSTVVLFGKTWRFHLQAGLGLSEEVYAEIIRESVAFIAGEGRRVIFDAEHFFDGYSDDREFALAMLKAAVDGGADTLVLCDTNGGSLPQDVARIVHEVKALLDTPLGIHAHNDGGLAVANSLMAVQAGATHVQGTISGVGERCGNANLTTILPTLLLKMGCKTGGDIDLTRLTEFSREVSEVLNMQPDSWAPYVGKSAFAHKGGVHVNAIMKNAALYEHIKPETVGNIRRVLISDLSGKSNIDYKARELGFKFSNNKDGKSRELAQWVKNMAYNSYQFDGAEASFELVIQEQFGDYKSYFELAGIDVHIYSTKDTLPRAVATLKVEVDGQTEHTAAEGVGPVQAMDMALRKALVRFFPSVAQVKLVDYKARVLAGSGGISSKVRVLITSSDGQRSWSTVGVSENIIEASWLALRDSLSYHLYILETAKVSQLEEHRL